MKCWKFVVLSYGDDADEAWEAFLERHYVPTGEREPEEDEDIVKTELAKLREDVKTSCLEMVSNAERIGTSNLSPDELAVLEMTKTYLRDRFGI